MKFGKLLVLKNTNMKNNRGEILWDCLCDCGKTKIVKTYNLIHGVVKSCGCVKTGPKIKDLSGNKYHKLTVLNIIGTTKFRDRIYKCKCNCGKISNILGRNLITGLTKSCGCNKIANDSNRWGSNNPNFNPNLTQYERDTYRFGEINKIWSFEVKQKYNFTCQICYKKDYGNLVSHHLYSYKTNPDVRFDLNNGICLCVKCHIKFHKKYGFKNNTKEQFDMFIKEIQICLSF